MYSLLLLFGFVASLLLLVITNIQVFCTEEIMKKKRSKNRKTTKTKYFGHYSFRTLCLYAQETVSNRDK
jgi:hypothetical protein